MLVIEIDVATYAHTSTPPTKSGKVTRVKSPAVNATPVSSSHGVSRVTTDGWPRSQPTTAADCPSIARSNVSASHDVSTGWEAKKISTAVPNTIRKSPAVGAS